jgi:Cu(I)/Ag(I) efflux system membrane fusion protein/cobalt-zinc-cadmium efflux system membrane fusion protein
MKKTRTITWLLLGAAALTALGAGFYTDFLRHAGHDEADHAADSTGSGTEKVQYTCSMHPFIIRDEPGLCPICGMELTPLRTAAAGQQAGGRKIRHWVSPMDPTYVRDEPGQDHMGHDLVPVYEDDSAYGQIAIDPVTIQNMGVRTAVVEQRNLARTIRTVGIVTYEESRQYSVNSKIEGWIEKLHINETGQSVRKGQALMEIYSPELVAAQQEYLLAVANRDRLDQAPVPEIAAGAERLLEATRIRLRYWDISEQQVNELTRSGKIRKTLTLYSPYSGVVTAKPVLEGMRVMAGMELLQISDLSRVWINADIYEFEMPWIKTGQRAMVELPAAGRPELSGTLTHIYPYLEGDTRTVRARIEFANPGLFLKPGMFANVSIAAESVSNATAVPIGAVLHSGKQQTVFVALKGGRFEPRTVTTGVRDDQGFIQVLTGLRPGEQVVTSAQFLFDSESRLQEAIRKMLQPEKIEQAEEADLEGLFQ